jgi:phenylacetate-CoA ligase
MSMYLEPAQHRQLATQYPWGEAFLSSYLGMSRDELVALQEERLQPAIARAWGTRFYQRLWSAHGIEPGDIRGMADLSALPLVDKDAIVADIEANPPFGTLGDAVAGGPRPQVLQTTSGTTGSPQPVLWGAWGREVQNALLGRTYQWLGVSGSDVVQSVYGHGPVNGGHYVREAVARYTEALLLTTGTGLETRSERQIAMMRQFHVTVLVGFADYLRRLAEVAVAQGLEPGRDLPVRLIIGQLPIGARAALESAWPGAEAFDWYGVADTGVVSTEGPDRDGQWVWEDANVIEITDVDTGIVMGQGGEGNLVVTSLGKSDVAPLIRFNTHDVTRVLPGTGAFDLPFQRTAGLLGRSDQMVKLRGINVYPTAISALLDQVPNSTGEYYCRVTRNNDGSDDMVVVLECRSGANAAQAEEVLSRALGVRIGVELVGVGQTQDVTKIASLQKPRRLVDTR